MEIFRHLRDLLGVLALLTLFLVQVLVLAQDQSGFISLDCGLQADSHYTDPTTGLNYMSDASFIDKGESRRIATPFRVNSVHQPMNEVRTFPSGTRNCYNFSLKAGDKYLIRASFLYGNYDAENKLPAFDLHLGPNMWASVIIKKASARETREIIHVLPSDDLFICLANTGLGTPFISALELRPLKNTTYRTQSGSLNLLSRLDIGAEPNEIFRYKDDVHDRIWMSSRFINSTQINTSRTIDMDRHNDFQPPSAVMRTASIPENASAPLNFNLTVNDLTTQLYIYLHFAEVQKLQANESRQINISLDGQHWYGPFSPDYLYTTTVYSPSPLRGRQGQYLFSIYKAGKATLPPLLNAIEIYEVNQLSQSQTDQMDVDAITNIKSMYEIERNWQGDPCAPQAYSWDGLNCSYNDPPRIISLKLSSSRLTRAIPQDMSNLTMIEVLDLSNNNLTGPIPEFLSQLTNLRVLDLSNNSLTGPVPEILSQLTNLRVLNLSGNRLNGTVPVELIERSKNNSLSLRVDNNPDLCSSPPCKKKKKKIHFVVPLVASVASFFILVAAASAIIFIIKRRKEKDNKVCNGDQSAAEANNRQVSYSDVLKITKNFQKAVGKGGFGTVYHGYFGDTQVAVKMLSSTSAQGYKQFQVEVKHLSRVHHRNLTSLVGYCDEASNMGLVYEYMANGNLAEHLCDKSTETLSWERRLRIAKEAAQGLEYLHNGCKPPIIHRDVKSTNILLNEEFQAKLADFGLSRTFSVEADHVSTVVAGTPGYLDPEYSISNRLTEKSDVYSFGVVLLEIITGRSVITKTHDAAVHISQWVSAMLNKGDLRSIVDSRLKEDFDTNSAWKALELALTCVSPTSSERPTMTELVTELSQCWAAEKARESGRHQTGPRDSIDRMISVKLDADQSPQAR
ncbi:hypothetical protein SLA2020_312630 [Shorea laevis]